MRCVLQVLRLILDVCVFPELADGVNYTSTQCGLSTRLTRGHLQEGTSGWVPSSLGGLERQESWDHGRDITCG